MSTAAAMQLRRARLREAGSEIFDVLVVGGGIHGASVCREATLRGYKVLLLEAHDYGWATSSRSSKLLHGGVRYLEQGNVRLVREALVERSRMLYAAGHLTRPQEFFFPVIPGQTRPRWQIQAGLKLYDLLARAPFFADTAGRNWEAEKAVSSADLQAKALRELGLRCSALFRYFDAQMDDTRLVIEHIVDAAQLKACTLNFCRVKGGQRPERAADPWRIRWREELSGFCGESQGRVLVNCSGPWLEELHREFNRWEANWPQPLYSRGTHLLFDRPWPHPSLILPSGIKGRYYFVLPCFSVLGEITLVGTTDREVKTYEEDPRARDEEIAELLGYLRRDLPGAGLNEERLFRSFCGIRTLAGTKAGRRRRLISDVSRSEAYLEQDRYVGLLGGKYTTVRATAEEIVDRLDRWLGKRRTAAEYEHFSRTRQLPGARGWSEVVRDNLVEELRLAFKPGTPEEEKLVDCEIQAAVRRFGCRARELIRQQPAGLNGLSALRAGQVRFCLLEEQAVDAQGVVARLGLDDLPERFNFAPEIIDNNCKDLLGR